MESFEKEGLDWASVVLMLAVTMCRYLQCASCLLWAGVNELMAPWMLAWMH